MPTYEAAERFQREFRRLTPADRARFLETLAEFIADSRRRTFRPRLRVKRVTGFPGIWEMTWAPDGRATFEYGAPVCAGDVHIIWRRIGSHEIFADP